MSLYSDMTDARSPKNIVFMEGDSDSWGYYVDGKDRDWETHNFLFLNYTI